MMSSLREFQQSTIRVLYMKMHAVFCGIHSGLIELHSMSFGGLVSVSDQDSVAFLLFIDSLEHLTYL